MWTNQAIAQVTHYHNASIQGGYLGIVVRLAKRNVTLDLSDLKVCTATNFYYLKKKKVKMVEPPNISYTLGCASWTTVLFLTYFYVICDLLLNRRMRNEESIS